MVDLLLLSDFKSKIVFNVILLKHALFAQYEDMFQRWIHRGVWGLDTSLGGQELDPRWLEKLVK
jgi:hypothetical protein